MRILFTLGLLSIALSPVLHRVSPMGGLALIGTGLVLLVADYFRGSPASMAKALPKGSSRNAGELETDWRDTIIDNLDRAIVVCSSDGDVKFANAKAGVFFKARALVGMNLHHVALSKDIESILDDALRSHGQEPISRELEVDYPEPSTLRVRGLRIGMDNVILWIADVSDIKRLETVRRDFVANVSHELRTPMASMRAMAETIEDDPDLTNEDRERYLSKIIAEIDRLTLLSDDLLTLASAESKPAQQSEIDLAEIARYTVQQTEQAAAAKGLTLEMDAADSVIVLGDRHRVIQVAMNLLQNAIRYTNHGGATVRVYEQGEHGVLEVEDSGIGIGRDHLPRIFERFYRVDAARSRETGGTGLGLAIVRHITESLGGKVEIESELGKGSTLRVFLPL